MGGPNAVPFKKSERRSPVVIQQRAHNSTHHSTFGPLSCWGRHVVHQLVSELRDGERLQPYSSRAGQRRKKNSVAAEDHVLDAGNPSDLERHAGLKRSHVSRMDTESLTRRQVLHDQLTRKLDPAGALPGHLLQQKSVTSKYPCTQRLLETHT